MANARHVFTHLSVCQSYVRDHRRTQA